MREIAKPIAAPIAPTTTMSMSKVFLLDMPPVLRGFSHDSSQFRSRGFQRSFTEVVYSHTPRLMLRAIGNQQREPARYFDTVEKDEHVASVPHPQVNYDHITAHSRGRFQLVVPALAIDPRYVVAKRLNSKPCPKPIARCFVWHLG